jgi:hypothetical protein
MQHFYQHFRYLLLFIFCLYQGLSFAQNAEAKKLWTVEDPFEQKVFIENKGQCNGMSNRESEIKFHVSLGKIELYFSTAGLTYRYDEYVVSDEAEARVEKIPLAINRTEEENRPSTKVIPHFVNVQWEGANPSVQLTAENKVKEYFTYPDLTDKSYKKCLKASAFKTLVYRNLYPNIDLQYTFPDGKEGIKYAFILHPGADVSDIKMHYYCNETIPFTDADGNIILPLEFGDITDHAPITTTTNNAVIHSSFSLNNSVVGFELGNYNASETVIIDPWTTVPTFPGLNRAYDVDFDSRGNVYIYGGIYPWREIKLDSTGTIQWTYTASLFYASGCPGPCYGDFAVDSISGCSYLVEGFTGDSAAHVIKLNDSGMQVNVFPGWLYHNEMWRVAFDYITPQLIIAGGGTLTTYQAYSLDTAFTNFFSVNVLSTFEPFHDISLLALDNSGSYYMATSRSFPDPENADNVLIKGPISTLLPIDYYVDDGYVFAEVSSISYVGNTTSATNGFNGMTASPNYLYTYDGKKLKKWNSILGVIIDSVQVTPTSFAWGGLDVDECEEIFAGTKSHVYRYDVNLNVIDSIAMPDSVYDIKLGPGRAMYVCGSGFVTAISLPPCGEVNIIDTEPSELFFNVFPNPFHTSSTVIIDSKLKLQGLKLVIYDVLGKPLQQFDLTSNKIEIHDLPAGIYFLSLEGLKTQAIKKLIVY